MPLPAGGGGGVGWGNKTPKFAVWFASCLLIYSQTSCHGGPGILAFLSPPRTKFPVFFLTTHVILGFFLRHPLSVLTSILKQPWARQAWRMWLEDSWPLVYKISFVSREEREGALSNIQRTRVMHFYKKIPLSLHTTGSYSTASYSSGIELGA